ncbi:ornithine cyclodeaminase [Rhizobium sp. BK529]|uniref:ornithine cyclodeaminase family protein n=1 Tax=unclassified Rhizobium TaxID=2613769 RepID=UPI001046201D|nr:MULTISPECIES: ornithine cyclodeaminase family protein [unclassified Rhizobium]MBB3594772.1 ornithine cyclodeaminase [Rhizobium sp. BK529]TCS02512.1 ornithine cyclodeaminase [Rhizobium sp. BK418]
MLVLDEDQTRAALPWAQLIDAIEAMFRSDCVMPVRHHHDMEVPGEENATLLLMPAWLPGQYTGIKTVSVFPGNVRRGLPAIFGSYLLSSAATGQVLALIDGGELTARRTAATSALASRYLSRPDAEEMLVCGTGRLSLNLMQAHGTVRPIQRYRIWGRNREAAERAAEDAQALGLQTEVVSNLEAAVKTADIVSCATLSSEPLVYGDWLKPGAHLDLVGAFKPSMRESDDTAVLRSAVYVDTRAGALSEGGDIVQPLKNGVLKESDLRGELAELISGARTGREDAQEITLFKSVGAALEDLAGAILAYEMMTGRK